MPSRSSNQKRQAKLRSQFRDYCKIEDISNVIATIIAKCYIIKPISPFKFIADELYTREGIDLPETYSNYNEIFELKKHLEYYKALAESLKNKRICDNTTSFNNDENFETSTITQPEVINAEEEEVENDTETGVQLNINLNLSEKSEDENDEIENTKKENKNEPLDKSSEIPEINNTDADNLKDKTTNDYENSANLSCLLNIISVSEDIGDIEPVTIDLKNNPPEKTNEISKVTVENSSEKPMEIYCDSYIDDDIRISEHSGHSGAFQEQTSNNTVKDTGCMVVIPSENITEDGLKNDPKSVRKQVKDKKRVQKGKLVTSVQINEECSTETQPITEIVKEETPEIPPSASYSKVPTENDNTVDDEIEEALRRMHSADNDTDTVTHVTNQPAEVIDNIVNEDLLSIQKNQPFVIVSRLSTHDTVMLDSDDSTLKSLCIDTNTEFEDSPMDTDTESNTNKAEPLVESKMEISDVIPESSPVKKSLIPLSDILSLGLEDDLEELDYEEDDLK